jgi:tetratricopeptide (TPR) repeat protein
MLSTELAGNDHLRVISGEEVARAGLAEPTATSPSHESLAQYANRLGANTIVYGAYTVSREKDGKSAAKLRLDLRLEDLSSDAPPMTLVKTGLTSDLFTLVSASGAEMRQRFGLGDISADSVAAVRRTLPTDQVAAQFYAEGLQRLRDFDPPGARDLLQKAAHIEPGHAGTHLALAEAWHAMGYENEARSEAARAVALGAGLPREELLEMQGELASFSSDWPHAMEIFRSLLTFYPDSVRYGLLLVRAQKGASRFEESLATLQSMRHPGLSRADEARIDLAESNDDLQLGNFRQAVAAADKAILIGTELGQNLMRAEGLWQKASGLERLGNSQDSLAASAQAQTLYHAAGDKQGQALALLMSGDVLYDSARTGEARKDFEDALALFKELGHVRNSSITMERIGNSYFDEGALTQSQHNYELALEGYKQTHWDSGMASAIGNLANVKETEGDLAGALESNAQGLALFEQVKDKRGTASTLSNMGNLEVEEGNLDLAGDYFTRAADVTVEISYTRGLAYARIGQGDVSLARNDISGALHQYEQAAKAIEGMDEPALQCAVQISQGIATLQGGNGKQAIGPLQQAADAALKIKEHGLATSALAALARAQLQAGKVPDAADSANRAVAESKAQFAPVSRLIATLALARVQIAQGNSRAAQESLRAAIPIAGHDGFLPLAMEARILEGRTVAGKDERRRQLDALSGEAASRGWKLLAADARRTSQ